MLYMVSVFYVFFSKQKPVYMCGREFGWVVFVFVPGLLNSCGFRPGGGGLTGYPVVQSVRLDEIVRAKCRERV